MEAKQEQKETKLMRLWTWQKRGLSLTGGRVNHELSDFYNNDNIPRIKTAYEELFGELGTSQIIWCYTQFEEAERKWKNRVRWELEVSEDHFLAIICNVAWSWIVQKMKCIPPKRFRDILKERQLEQKFHDYWEGKTEEQLWKIMFRDRVIEGCSDVLLRHPIEESWVIDIYNGFPLARE